jgi:rubrerythrin
MAELTNIKTIKGTKTERNLVAAYLTESSAYTRYMFYAAQADKEEYFPIGEVFRATAENELHHSKGFFKLLLGGKVTVEVPVDAGIIGDTETNLRIAIDEEILEGIQLYTKSAQVADEEGFSDIAKHFRAIAAVEATHRNRFDHYLKHLQNHTLWKREKIVKWKCLVCGFIYEGNEPPQACPACGHPYQHFMALDCD